MFSNDAATDERAAKTITTLENGIVQAPDQGVDPAGWATEMSNKSAINRGIAT